MGVQEASKETAQQTALSGDGQSGQAGPAGNVEQIREILFGPQMREYGQRFTRIEERLSQETEELKAEVRRRLDALEAYTRQEVKDLGERLRAERGERTESASRLSQSLADSVKSLERCLTESDERMSNVLSELRQSTFDRIKGVLDDLTAQTSNVEESQNRRIEELRGRSIDRFSFASLLTELALRVQGQFGLIGLGESDAGSKS
jgi:DNA anti-recombination protein RmuC